MDDSTVCGKSFCVSRILCCFRSINGAGILPRKRGKHDETKQYLGIFIICLLSFCNRAQARAFEVDGIYYSVIGAEGDITVEVVSPEKGGTYEGDIAIPASV